MMKKREIILMMIVLFLGLTACQKDETLDKTSVLTQPKQSDTELDDWLVEHYNQPYNMNVLYKWKQESTLNSNILYPPKQENVKKVMEVAKTVWLDLFENYMSDDIKENLPIEIKLFGGKNELPNWYESLSIKGASPYQMTLFRVDEFQKDEEHINMLIRNIYNNYIRLLIWKKPIDREAFRALNSFPYKREFNDINTNNIYYEYHMRNIFSSGFYSHLAYWNDVDDDFAETASVLLTHSEKQIDNWIEETTRLKDVPTLVSIIQRFKDWVKSDYIITLEEINERLRYVQTLEEVAKRFKRGEIDIQEKDIKIFKKITEQFKQKKEKYLEIIESFQRNFPSEYRSILKEIVERLKKGVGYTQKDIEILEEIAERFKKGGVYTQKDIEFLEEIPEKFVYTQEDDIKILEGIIERLKNTPMDPTEKESSSIYEEMDTRVKVRKTLEAKRKFVIEYFKSEYNIDFRKLNYSALKKKEEVLK